MAQDMLCEADPVPSEMAQDMLCEAGPVPGYMARNLLMKQVPCHVSWHATCCVRAARRVLTACSVTLCTFHACTRRAARTQQVACQDTWHGTCFISRFR